MSNLYRGTTPTIILHVTNEDFNMANISECHVTIQNDNGTNKKVFENPTIDAEEKTITVPLTQEDTLSFKYGNINIQARVKLISGSVIASPIITTNMNRILEETIL